MDMEALLLRDGIPGFEGDSSDDEPPFSQHLQPHRIHLTDRSTALAVPARHPDLNVRQTLSALCFGNFRFLKQIGKRSECLEWEPRRCLIDYRNELDKEFKAHGWTEKADTIHNFQETAELYFTDHSQSETTPIVQQDNERRAFTLAGFIFQTITGHNVTIVEESELQGEVRQREERMQLKKAKKNKKERERIKARKQQKRLEAVPNESATTMDPELSLADEDERIREVSPEDDESNNELLSLPAETREIHGKDSDNLSQSSVTLPEDNKTRERAEKKAKDKRRRERRRAEKANSFSSNTTEREAKATAQETAKHDENDEHTAKLEEVEKRQQELRQLQGEKVLHQAKIDSLRADIRLLSANEERLQQQLHEAKAGRQADNDRLKRQLEEAKSETAMATQLTEAREKTIQNQKSEIHKTHQAHQKAKAKISTLEKKVQEKVEEVTSEAARAEKFHALAQDAEELEGQNKCLEEEIRQLKVALQAETAKTEEERREKEWQMKEVEDREGRINVDRRLLENAAFDVGILRSDLASHKRRLEESEDARRALEAQHERLKVVHRVAYLQACVATLGLGETMDDTLVWPLDAGWWISHPALGEGHA